MIGSRLGVDSFSNGREVNYGGVLGNTVIFECLQKPSMHVQKKLDRGSFFL